MKNFIIKTISVLFIAYLLQRWLPWYVIIIVPFIFSLIIKTNGILSFFSAFISIVICWFAQAYWIHHQSMDILTSKMASVFSLPTQPLLLIGIVSFAGGMVAGLASYTGNAMRNILLSPPVKKKSLYDKPDYMFRRK
jgi:hypothetical protein